MLPLTSHDTLALHRQDHAERTHLAERERTARQLARVRRARRWAGRLERMAARLDRLARIQRARLSSPA